MAIAPINGISVRQNYNSTVNFTGRRQNEEGDDRQPLRRSTNNMAAVPVVVLMAMTPGMLNGKQPVTVLPANEMNITEVLAQAPEIEEAENTYQITEADYAQYTDMPRALNSRYVQYKENFRMNGKNYTMYFSNPARSLNRNLVTTIHFVPEDFELIKDAFDNELNSPPEMVQFRYHKVSDDMSRNFVGAVVKEKICNSDGQNVRFKTSEIRLPDEIANRILGLILGDMDLKASKGIVDSYVHVSSPNLMTTKIERPINR